MPQDNNFNELVAFLTVARERSFTRAAAKLGVSQSVLSQTVRGLEEKLGLRLLTRTTRSVSPTQAGERLLERVGPRFEEIQFEIAALSEMRERPAGTIRITAGEHPAISVLAPALAQFLPDHPDINVEVIVDYGLTDIVTERYDAGIRLGEQLAKDMIAVRIGPEMCMAAVGAPSYFERHPCPDIPQDLTAHNCINMRLPTHGTIYPWEFEKDGRELRVRVEGQMVFNNIAMRIGAVLDGLGLAYMPEDQVQPYVEDGRLIRVLEDWCQPFSGYHLYYPNRRHASPAFTLFVDALRYRGK
ncbi:LysR family transcriptional regulator [Rhizobium leguminosarum]|uniref:LysR family transcriptional regulator n=1 Tax=Rhizobium leguminosarum TaxID=384 RepID=UPI0014424AD7|nr:LysR family transcriptional regulator [Rhizobium leguminosarum]MBY5841446.1 LysR family transcriptional regulator [Rhizobium leguminosarum]NKM82085.1 LysR family transcriptional regulator [Rhizobium leguminosarum bv. viciae]QSZ06274.1 LysR family transcriptional regulator [Rhizobium leguminosarum]